MLLFVPLRVAGAQPDADPSGHWEGAVQAPGKSVTIEVDLAKNARGELVGTLGNPAQGGTHLHHDGRGMGRCSRNGGGLYATMLCLSRSMCDGARAVPV
jgi:hypothetical protein